MAAAVRMLAADAPARDAAMSEYRQLTYEQRCQIDVLKKIDDSRIFNATVRRLDNDLNVFRVPLSDLDVDPDAAQLNTRLGRCIQVIDAWRSAGVLSNQFSPVG
jgi:hypothetical protein